MASYKYPRRHENGAGRRPSNEMELSNSTMAQFLGGKKRTWMYPHVPAVQNQVQTMNARTLSLDPSVPDASTNISQPPQSPACNIHTDAGARQSQSLSTTTLASDTITQTEYLGMEQGPAQTAPLPLSPPHSDDAHPTNNGTLLVGHAPAYIATELSAGEHISTLPGSLRVLGTVLTPAHGRSFDLSEKASEAMTRSKEGLGLTMSQGGPEIPHQYPPVVEPLASNVGLLPLGQRPTPSAPAAITGVPSQFRDDQEALHAKNLQDDVLPQILHNSLPKVLDRIETVRKSPIPTIVKALEDSRLRLLKDACASGDAFYLVFHQVFCLVSLPNCQLESFQFSTYHTRGLEKVAELILPNTSLLEQSVKWFAMFPAPLDQFLLVSPSYCNAYQQAKNSLELLGRNWDAFRTNRLAHKIPPLVHYIETDLGIFSPVLQNVVFTAIHRLLWIGPQDDCFQKASALLVYNQRTSAKWRLQRSGGNPPSVGEINSYHQRIVAEYQRLHQLHREHTQQVNLPAVLPVHNQAASSMTGVGSPQPNDGSYVPRGIPTSTPAALHHNNASVWIATSSSSERHPLSPRNSIDRISSGWTTHTRMPSFPGSGTVQQHDSRQNISLANRVASAPTLHHENQGNERGSLSFQGQRTAVLPSTQTERLSSSGRSTPQQIPIQAPYNLQQAGAQSSSIYQPTLQPSRAFPFASGPNHQVIRYPQSQANTVVNIPRIPPPSIQSPHSSNFPISHPTQMNNSLGGHSMPPVPQENTALHQAHLRDADMVVVDSTVNAQTGQNYYEYLKELTGPPIGIKPDTRNLYCRFQISAAQFSKLPKDEPQPYGAPPLRRVHIGDCLYRLRCIAASDTKNTSRVQWSLEETSWPSNITIVLNDNYLELRRKAHNGKDLPIDITSHIREGLNVLHIAMLRVGDEITTESLYALGVEVIEVADYNSVKAKVILVKESRILSQMKKQSTNEDPDIEIVVGNLVVGIIDPFSSTLITTPARGEFCRHYECFDLDTYLQTRQGSPCKPEQFRCPICNGDTRPQRLIVDGWLQQVLEEVRKMKRLDARAIVVDNTGAWTIKEEEIEGESGDGTGVRRRTPGTAAEVARPSGQTGGEVVVID